MILLTANLKSISILFVNADYGYISLNQTLPAMTLTPRGSNDPHPTAQVSSPCRPKAAVFGHYDLDLIQLKWRHEMMNRTMNNDKRGDCSRRDKVMC